MRVELLWFGGCPNRVAVQRALQQVLASRGLEASIIQSIQVDANSIDDLKFPGSPTIRIDGDDIEPGFVDVGEYSMSCRVYRTERGVGGVPDKAWLELGIDRALNGAGGDAS